MRSDKRLVCVNLEVTSACSRTLEAEVKDADAKYAKIAANQLRPKRILVCASLSYSYCIERKRTALHVLRRIASTESQGKKMCLRISSRRMMR